MQQVKICAGFPPGAAGGNMSELDDLARRVQELEIENRTLKQENDAYRSNLEANGDDQSKLETMVVARTQQLRTALDRSYDITLEALGEALDLKVVGTEGHSRRVTAFTIGIARSMDLQKDKINILARATVPSLESCPCQGQSGSSPIPRNSEKYHLNQ